MHILSTKIDPEAITHIDTAWFFYGATGAGKTTAAATFPKPLFMVPTNEGSELTLQDRDLPFTRLGVDAQGQRVSSIRQQMEDNLKVLEGKAREMLGFNAAAWDAHEAGEKEKATELFDQADAVFPWRTIIIESMTHLTDLLIEEIQNTGKIKGQMDQAKWGDVGSFYRQVHARLRSLPVHVVYTALDKWDEGASRGEPNISGATRDKLPSACDSVGYCIEERVGTESVYRIHFRRYNNFIARSRFPLPRYVDNFNFMELEANNFLRG